VSEIEAEIEKQEIIKGNSERKITELKTELTAAQNIEPPEAEQQSAQPTRINDAFVTETIKQFNQARNGGVNPLKRKGA
jgi:hypothetical protein